MKIIQIKYLLFNTEIRLITNKLELSALVFDKQFFDKKDLYDLQLFVVPSFKWKGPYRLTQLTASLQLNLNVKSS